MKEKPSSKARGYCIICKELVGDRYSVTVRDAKNSTGIKAYACRDCFNRFLSSHANEGKFKVSQFLGWRRYKDGLRK